MIRTIEKESKTISEELDYSDKKIVYQKNLIKEYEVKYKENVEIYNKQRNEFLVKEKENNHKFEVLMNRYDELRRTVK